MTRSTDDTTDARARCRQPGWITRRDAMAAGAGLALGAGGGLTSVASAGVPADPGDYAHALQQSLYFFDAN
ncbi:MAG: hypothetical protein ACOCYZ_02340, partial [Halococcoides sp.]